MAYPVYGMAWSILYEFYASLSGLTPKTAYDKLTHEYNFYSQGSIEGLKLSSFRSRYWRTHSGLTPADSYTDSEHMEAWLLTLQDKGYPATWINIIRSDLEHPFGIYPALDLFPSDQLFPKDY